MNTPDGSEAGFTCEITQEESLHRDAELAEALITVRARGIGASADANPQDWSGDPNAARAAVVVIVDRSESMGWRPARLPAAKQAAAAAVDLVRDGVLFALVAGNRRAAMIYPPQQELVPATQHTRRKAVEHLATLNATGETKISEWLALTRDLFEPYPRAIRHALLFTDGKNQSEEAWQLDSVLESCRGMFRCDTRGVGDDWDRDELRRIANALQGSADAVPRASALEGELRRLMADAMRSAVPDLAIRLRLRKGVRVRYLRQHFPSVVDLTAHAVAVDSAASDYSTGPWGDGVRQYRVCFETTSAIRTAGKKITLARVDLMVRGVGGVVAAQVGEPRLVVGQWTDERAPETRMTTHFSRQQELGDLLVEGGTLWRARDYPAAANMWGRAAEVARAIGNDPVLERLARVLESVESGAAPRLKSAITLADVLYLEMGDAVPTYLRPESDDEDQHDVGPPASDGADDDEADAQARLAARRCGKCTWISPSGARICSRCGTPLGAGGAT